MRLCLTSLMLPNKAVGSFSSTTWALLRLHVLPRPVVCQAAWCQARLSLPIQPPSCRLLNNAIRHSPLTTPPPFPVQSQCISHSSHEWNKKRLSVGVNVAANDCLSVRQTSDLVLNKCAAAAASWVQLQMQTHVLEMQYHEVSSFKDKAFTFLMVQPQTVKD